MVASNTIPAPPGDIIAFGRDRWKQRYGEAVAPALEAAGNIIRTREIFIRFAEGVLAGTNLDLPFSDYEILCCVEVEPHGIPLSRIRHRARRYFNHQTSITNLVSRLVSQGLLATTADPDDRRVTLVNLTRAGGRKLRKAQELLAELRFGFSALTPREQNQLCRLFVAVRAAHDDPALIPDDAVAAGRVLWEKTFGKPQAGAAMEAASQLVRVREILVHSFDKILKDFRLPFNDYDILGVIVETDGGELPLSRIGLFTRRHFNHQTSITNVVARLSEQRLVKTRPDPSDGRVTFVEVTRQGERRFDEASTHLAEIAFGLGTLGESDLSQLTTLLMRVRRSHGDLSV